MLNGLHLTIKLLYVAVCVVINIYVRIQEPLTHTHKSARSEMEGTFLERIVFKHKFGAAEIDYRVRLNYGFGESGVEPFRHSGFGKPAVRIVDCVVGRCHVHRKRQRV